MSFLGSEKIPPTSDKKVALEPVLDSLDENILENANKNSGANIAKIIHPLRGPEWSDPTLRNRLHSLARDGFLRLEKTRTGKVLVFPIER
jgi:hypothetical protein